MMRTPTLTRLGLATAALGMTMAVAACGSSSGSSSDSSKSDTSASSPSPSATQTSNGSVATGPFGPACAMVPKSGPGSVQGMTQDPVATAASHNPLLSTLVTAVKKAGLVDTLNSAQQVTVLAPDNDAFKKIPPAQLHKLLANKAMLTKVLTHHVIAGKLSPEQLQGPHKTLAGDTVTVQGSGEDFTVPSVQAKVVCGNVTTANATVYVIDTVLTK